MSLSNTNDTELPNGWITVNLDDVCGKIANGGNFIQKDGIDGLPVSRIETISFETVDLNRVKYCNSYSDTDLEKYKLKYGDILFSHINSDSHLGKTAVFKHRDKLVLHGINLLRIQVNELISPFFLNLFFQHYRYKGDFLKIAQRAVNQSSINQKSLKQILIPLPPLPEQERIFAKIEELFSELDKGVEALRTAQQQLKVYRQAVLKWAFEGKLTEEWRNRQSSLPTATQLLEQIKSEREKQAKTTGKKMKPIMPIFEEELTALPAIPDGWSWIKMEYLGELARGKSKHRPRNDKRLFGGPYPFIQTGEVKAANEVITEFENTYSEFGLSQSKLWPKGTLCITIAANIAETAFLGFDACFPDSIVGFSPNCDLTQSKYIFYFFKGHQKKIEAYAPATAQKNINLNTLENLYVPYCSLIEQIRIIEEIESRLSVADKLEQAINQSLAQAEALRQSILKKAFEGRLVPQVPNDEPAGALLARIKAEREKNQLAKQPRKISRKKAQA